MKHQVNVAIQVLPLGLPDKAEVYRIIDEAIATIKRSGLVHLVCPFETVIEGDYDAVMQLINEVQDTCRAAGAEEVLINLKLHRNFVEDLSIGDKVGKYR